MKVTPPIRVAVRRALLPATLLATLCSGPHCAQAQAVKPSAATPIATQSTVSDSPAKSQLSVDYVAGKLTVNAANASLNQILSEVSRTIGMKVTGGVADERVYGQYGPSAPSVVLAALLDGTTSNMLLVGSTKGPTELILTPRMGGPTPPSPHAATPEPEEEPAQEPPQPTPAHSPAQIVPHRGLGHPPTPGAPPPDTNPDDATSTDQPNGTKTPQQINNDLRQLQQQQTTPAPQ
jgi:hypothetical protein